MLRGTSPSWHRHGVKVGLALNVSPSELNPGFAETLLERLGELGLPGAAVTIEITESPAMTATQEERDALATLIGGGVGVSVDDFGRDSPRWRACRSCRSPR